MFVAHDTDFAAHQRGELLADGKPKSGPAVFAGGRGIGLPEFVEDQLALVFRNADAGIFDAEFDPRLSVIDTLAVDLPDAEARGAVAGSGGLDQVPALVENLAATFGETRRAFTPYAA